MTVWTSETDDILVCRQVRHETADVKSFIFAARNGARFEFVPGQFLTFDVPVGGGIVNRCYTISSSPTRPDRIAITVKRVPGGPVSNWLHDNMRPGCEIRATGPMGDFCHRHHRAGKYLFLSGGSGITPLMAMARETHDLALETDIAFLHSARSPADIIFRDELALIARHLPQFRLHAICEADSPGERWGGLTGRLTADGLRALVPDLLSREVFTCGPAPYMAAVRGLLGLLGFDMAHYHEESFDFGAATPEAAPAAPAGDTPVFRVEFTRSRRVIDCPADRTVLEAARAAGMRLPSSCTRGLCGTCKSRIATGKVEMKHAGGIRQREIDQGLALICCSKPLTDLVIER
ncbi:hybrid-cluster NAD(P)-dependent oxidoreductase [Zavarzinia compransoris]|uniref:Hybrid-cluster NAD(P)-dependent oxidoreductase n=1 Tax=Zavarzinia compransoris TaxID=1264899 RepID=A0A317DYJ2_9PROT|nr:hybrid-cluster NAD(P)-dependent oxidoreductase [Zavarzinia compransoris]PWR18063.1 hybrid-cluster NAD(P)-dependent oxidoreductase [Zavarzinia compransoris]TDP43465.1 ferredoxin-NADP reductase [Zavarzinia compransoris]